MLLQRNKKSGNAQYEKTEKKSKKKKSSSKKKGLTKKDLKRQRVIQNAIYYDAMFKNGICAVDDNGTYSSCFQFSDINYQIATQEDQHNIFAKYMETLNSLGNGHDLQLLVHNRIIDEDEFEQYVLMPEGDDHLTIFRQELNDMMRSKVMDGNNRIVTEKYMVYNTVQETYEKAKKEIAQFDNEYERKFSELGCVTTKIKGKERLRLMHNIMYPETKFQFSYDNLEGYDTTKDCISPSQLDFKVDHFILDGRYCRVLFLKDYSTELSDEMINLLTKLEHNLVISFRMKALPRGEDILLIKNKIASMEQEMVGKQEKAMVSGFDPELAASSDLRLSYNEAQQELEDVQQRNQRLFECQFLVMVNAKTEEEMEEITKSIMIIAKNRTCQMDILRYQQEEGLNACLPIGYRVPYRNRTLTTSVCAIFMPFTSQELMDRGDALYYGQNTTTNNMIMCDRRQLKNPSGWYFGVPGSGKSMAVKREIAQVMCRLGRDELIVIDPEDEYKYLAEELGGTIVNVNNKSHVHINALDGDPEMDEFVSTKADFCQTFTAQIMCRQIRAEEKSIIDRAVRSMYSKYFKKMNEVIKPDIPTLKTFWQELRDQPEDVAKGLATGIEMYVDGSYDLFSGQSNININNRLVVYNIRDMEETIKPVSMLVILESLWSRIMKNYSLGKRTWIWIDEIYILFKYEYCATFLFELFKRARKFGAVITGITQNVEDLINSPTASTMLSNSEFIYMLSQSQTDKESLGALLHLSNEQLSYLSNARKGSGLLYNGNRVIIGFKDEIPKGTRLYRAMTSDFEERKAIERGERLKGE